MPLDAGVKETGEGQGRVTTWLPRELEPPLLLHSPCMGTLSAGRADGTSGKLYTLNASFRIYMYIFVSIHLIH